MSKKPSLSSLKKKRLKEAEKELEQENSTAGISGTKQTTVVLDAELLYGAKEVALKRKKAGIEPSSVTGMIRKALKEIVDEELGT